VERCAEHLRAVYGLSWLATDITVIGAAIDPKTRRDLGPMNPNRSKFGPEIDYGRARTVAGELPSALGPGRSGGRGSTASRTARGPLIGEESL
jgi:hypothetical protein